jgi:hypothetical protein
VFVGVKSSHLNITGNAIWNEGQGGASGSGVFIQSANDVLISGNHIYDTQTTHTMSSGVAGVAGARNAIIDNLFGTFGGPAIAITAASDTVIVGPTLGEPGTSMAVIGNGISYNNGFPIGFDWTGSAVSVAVSGNGVGTLPRSTDSHAIAFTWGGAAMALQIDGTPQGNVLTDQYMASRPNAANDVAAAALGVAVNQTYRNGSVLMVRVV